MLTLNMISMHQNFFTLSLFQELCITLIEKNRYQQNGEVNHGQLNQHLQPIPGMQGNIGTYPKVGTIYPLYVAISIGGHHIPYIQKYPQVATISLLYIYPYVGPISLICSNIHWWAPYPSCIFSHIALNNFFISLVRYPFKINIANFFEYKNLFMKYYCDVA